MLCLFGGQWRHCLGNRPGRDCRRDCCCGEIRPVSLFCIYPGSCCVVCVCCWQKTSAPGALLGWTRLPRKRKTFHRFCRIAKMRLHS
jgi:hypothetical protein